MTMSDSEEKARLLNDLVVFLFGKNHGGKNRAGQDQNHDAQGDGSWDLEKVGADHLDSDKNQHHGESVVQIVEDVHEAGEREVHGTKAKNGEDVRCIDDES